MLTPHHDEPSVQTKWIIVGISELIIQPFSEINVNGESLELKLLTKEDCKIEHGTLASIAESGHT
jgi:hypothetical protein